MNVLGRLHIISNRHYFLASVIASLSGLMAIAFIGLSNEAVAHHPDFFPLCPDVESGFHFATINGGKEEYVKFGPGQTTTTASGTGTAGGICELWAYPSPSEPYCALISSESPYISSVTVHRKKTYERGSWGVVAGVGGPGQNLGGSATAIATLNAGVYWLRTTSSAYRTACQIIESPVESGIVKMYVNTPPPKEDYCPTGSGGNNGPQHWGNPCDSANGNKSQQDTDYESAVKGLSIVRNYNSKVNRDHGLGVGWTTSFIKRIEIGTNMIRVRRANGSSEALVDNSGAWQSGLDGTLEVTQDANGYTVTLANGDTETYSLSGKILTENTNGYTLTYSYDANGNLTQVENDFGHNLIFTFDSDDRIASITTPGGTIYQYGYDGNGNLEIVTHPDSSTRQYHYEDTSYINALTGITDENGDRFATFAYDSSGWATLTEYATTDNGSPQEKFQLSYNIFETVATVTDPIGTQTSLNFAKKQGVNKLTKATNLTDYKALTQVFDTKGNLTSRTDEVGRKTTYTYNADNQRLTMVEASGTASARTTTYEYLSADEDLVTKVIAPSVYSSGQREIVTGYDTDRNPTTVTVNGYTPSGTAVSRTTTMAYDTDSNLTSIDGPRTDLSDITTFEYYSCTTGTECGQLKKVTNPLGHITTYDTYDGHGKVTQATDPNGLITSYTYDSRGWLASVVQTPTTGPTRTTSYAYDDMGQVLTVTSPSGAVLTYTYDQAHDLKSISDNFGNQIEYSYDLKGNRTEDTTKDPSSNITRTVTTAYDIRNRIDTINAAGSVTDLIYNAVGDLTTNTDPNLNGTTHNYDPMGRLLSTVDALSGSTTYNYNENDELIGVVAPNGANTTYSYDDLGNQLSLVSPDTGTTTFTHDDAGNILTKTDARSITTTYTYDALNRVATISYPDTSLNVTMTYDVGTNQKGLLTSMTDAAGSVTYTHDQFGNLTQESRTIDSVAYVTSYSYDTQNLVTQMTYPSGRTVDYTRNVLGQITAVDTDYGATSQAVASSVTYEPFGPLTGLTFGNNLAMTRTFDQQYRLTAQTTGTVQNLTFTLDAAGNIDAITDNVDTSLNQTFDYDALNRLTQDVGSYGTKDYNYDSVGNRLTRVHDNGSSTITQTLTFATNSNRMATRDGNTVVIDTAGNTTSDPVLDLTFNYGDQNRMEDASLSSVLQASYTYSGNGQRLKKVEATGAQRTFILHFGSDGKIIGETVYDSLSNKIEERDYIWLDMQPLAQSERTFSGGSQSGSSFVYLHADQINTPRIATDSGQTVVWRWDSDVFGIGLPDTDPDSNSVHAQNSLRFSGQYSDPENGSAYNYFRDYEFDSGRYLQSDPIGLMGGLSTYGYVSQNPSTSTDPFGLVKWTGSVIEGGGAFVVGGNFASFRLTSECINNRQATVRVWAAGPSFGFGFGVKDAPSAVVGGSSSVCFRDNLSGINPSVFDGLYSNFTLGGSAGVAAGLVITVLGQAGSCGPTAWGITNSVGIGWAQTLGTSRVISVKWDCC